jgi:hypothetical protein
MELNAIAYVSGVAIKGFRCLKCRENIFKNNDEDNLTEQLCDAALFFNNLKRYNDFVKFSTPSVKILKISIYIYAVFNQKMGRLFYESRFYVKSRLKLLFPYDKFQNLSCQKCFDSFVDKFLNVLIQAFLKQNRIKLKRLKLTNLRDRQARQEKRNRKASKLNLN